VIVPGATPGEFPFAPANHNNVSPSRVVVILDADTDPSTALPELDGTGSNTTTVSTPVYTKHVNAADSGVDTHENENELPSVPSATR
jgi:hypothetical protein